MEKMLCGAFGGMRVVRSAALAAAISSALAIGAGSAQAWTLRTLYTFAGGNDGSRPNGLVRDKRNGNLYGTTAYGGRKDAGTVFKITPDGTEQVLYTFAGRADGGNPHAGLVLDSAANLYGTAAGGGNLDNCFGYGCGVMFKLAPDGTYTVLHTFTGDDGQAPEGRLLRDSTTGDLYGTTYAGGAGEGVAFKLAANGTYTVLHVFRGPFQSGDGYYPSTGVIMDGGGNLYGATFEGGDYNCHPDLGCGIVYKLGPDGSETVLYAFPQKGKGGPDGGLVRDGMGKLYGTAGSTVFRLAPDGAFKILHAFRRRYKFGPQGDLVLDRSGTLYGATEGEFIDSPGQIFQIASDGTESVLYSFPTGTSPDTGVIGDKAGNLYGTTNNGGDSGNGVVFELMK
jgi:uncharacterized repeat protein (TIGR03803 family)